jgi:hypothetical protein
MHGRRAEQRAACDCERRWARQAHLERRPSHGGIVAAGGAVPGTARTAAPRRRSSAATSGDERRRRGEERGASALFALADVSCWRVRALYDHPDAARARTRRRHGLCSAHAALRRCDLPAALRLRLEARDAANGCAHVQGGNRLAVSHALLPQSHAAGCRALWRGAAAVAPPQLAACPRTPASRTGQRGPTHGVTKRRRACVRVRYAAVRWAPAVAGVGQAHAAMALHARGVARARCCHGAAAAATHGTQRCTPCG